jgi:hypothetical protein
MRAASRKHIIENYSWDAMLEDIFQMRNSEVEITSGIRFKNQPIPFYSDMI